MSSIIDLPLDLRQHLDLCQELLAVVVREGEAMRRADSTGAGELFQAKKNLLPRLNRSLDQLKRQRLQWQSASPAERARHPEVGSLLRLNQDLIMRIIVLDRENEQALLRRGLVPPRHLPSANRQRPHFVAGLYQRNQGDGRKTTAA